MTVTEVLQLMETLIYKHDGKEFEDLHKEIIIGLLEYKTYREIADKMNYDPEYVGNVSRELYEVLSKELKQLGKDEEVRKSNFNTTIEKIVNSCNHYFLQNINNTHGNLCLNTSQEDIINKSNSVNQCYYDLTLAPQIINFHNRETELQTLTHWILNQNTHLTQS
jgi:hypothetical protein